MHLEVLATHVLNWRYALSGINILSPKKYPAVCAFFEKVTISGGEVRFQWE
jgi:hypothetical protein